MAETSPLDTVQIPGAPEPKHGGKENLAAHKAAFDALEKQRKEGEEPTPKAAEKALKEVKAPKPPKPVKAAKAEEPAPEKGKSEPKKEGKAASDVDRLRAKLLLSGAPKAVVDSLSDEDVGEWWKNREEREREYASALERAAALEKKLKALEEPTSKPSEPTKGVPTEELDLDDLAEELAAQFGEDESGLLLKALRGLVSPLQAKVQGLEDMLAAARSRGVEDISKTNRGRLAEKLPFLADSDADHAWKVLHGMVEQAFKESPSKFSSAEAAYDDAFQKLYGHVLSAQQEVPAENEPEEDTKAEEAAQIEASTPTPPKGPKHERKAGPLDAHFAAWRALERGDPEDVDGARKAYYGRARLVQ